MRQLAIRDEIGGSNALRSRAISAKLSFQDDLPAQYFVPVQSSPRRCQTELFVRLAETSQRDPIHEWPGSPSPSKSTIF